MESNRSEIIANSSQESSSKQTFRELQPIQKVGKQ